MTETSSSSIPAQEWRWAIGWSLLILLLSCGPYLLATWAAPDGWEFGGFLVNPQDGHSYLAKMRQGADGNWLFQLTYTPEPHQGAFIFTFYLALGHLAALTHLPLIYMFHLARLLSGLLLLGVAFWFIARVTPRVGERRLAFVFLLTSSGLGWLGALFGAFPIDLWIPEAFVPYSLYANPHFCLGMALMLLLFGRVAWPEDHQGLKGRVWSGLLWPGLAALALGLILPFALLAVWAVLAVFLGWLYVTERRIPWPHLWPAASVVIFSAPVVLYDYWVSTVNPVLAGWGAQNVTAAPRVLDLALGYGLLGLLAVAGGWLVGRSRSRPERGEWLVLIWAVTTLVLVYLPFELQRRLINGLHIPLSILAAIGLRRWLAGAPLRLRYRRLLTTAVVTVGALGTLFVWSVPLLAVWRESPASGSTALLFIRRDELAAFTWLDGQAAPDDVVLASPRLGMFVPSQTGARAYYGHPFETIEAAKKRSMAEAFYRGDVAEVQPPADFVIYGPSEQALGRPSSLSTWTVRFSRGEVLIYGSSCSCGQR